MTELNSFEIPSRVANCLFCAQIGRIMRFEHDVHVRLDDQPVVVGHSLLCTELHYPSFADVQAETMRNAERLLERVLPAMTSAFGKIAVLEHGRTAHCLARDPAERFCHHAHLHLMPLQVEPLVERLDNLLPRVAEGSLSLLRGARGTEDGYLYAGSAEGGVVYRADRPLPPHFLRDYAAQAWGVPDAADWSGLVDARRSQEFKDEAWDALRDALHPDPERV